MRTLLSLFTVFFATVLLAPIAMVAGLMGVEEKPGSIYERLMRRWAILMNRAAGVRVVVHGAEHIQDGAVYVANHVSWYDVFAVAEVLPRYTWIAKAELRSLPIFGRGAESAGIIFLERENRMSAFDSYKDAAKEVLRGRNVIVCPEGTRGPDYGLRPFKKGPFVLAVAAQAPVIPTVVYGAREVMRKGSFRIRPGTVHVHFLDPIPTQGLTYDERNALMQQTWNRMADALESVYGVVSRRKPPRADVAPGALNH